jgi:hypothetical protein
MIYLAIKGSATRTPAGFKATQQKFPDVQMIKWYIKANGCPFTPISFQTSGKDSIVPKGLSEDYQGRSDPFDSAALLRLSSVLEQRITKVGTWLKTILQTLQTVHKSRRKHTRAA